MAITDGSTIAKADLNGVWGTSRATINALWSTYGREMHQMHLARLNFNNTVAKQDRSIEFTPQDDLELLWISVIADGGAAGPVLTAKLEVDGDETDGVYLLEKTVQAQHTVAGAGLEKTDVDYSQKTGDKIYLLAGVRYRLVLESNSATVTLFAQAKIVLRAPWRRQ